jgi:hypothetical protein
MDFGRRAISARAVGVSETTVPSGNVTLAAPTALAALIMLAIERPRGRDLTNLAQESLTIAPHQHDRGLTTLSAPEDGSATFAVDRVIPFIHTILRLDISNRPVVSAFCCMAA